MARQMVRVTLIQQLAPRDIREVAKKIKNEKKIGTSAEQGEGRPFGHR